MKATSWALDQVEYSGAVASSRLRHASQRADSVEFPKDDLLLFSTYSAAVVLEMEVEDISMAR
jgi:hypothetical protein